MKRRELIRHLQRFRCVLIEEGAKHTKYINLADPRRVTTVPRHTEIADLLARKHKFKVTAINPVEFIRREGMKYGQS